MQGAKDQPSRAVAGHGPPGVERVDRAVWSTSAPREIERRLRSQHEVFILMPGSVALRMSGVSMLQPTQAGQA